MPGFKKVKKGTEVTRLNDEVIEKICNNLRLGHYIETAVVVAGVPKRTFYDWCKKAHKNPKSIYMRLLHAVEKAQGDCETRDLLVIDKCANGRKPTFLKDENGKLILSENGNPIFEERGMDPDWSASAWRLERRFPKRWNKTDKQEVKAVVTEAEETKEEAEIRRKEVEEEAKEALLKMALAGDN